VSRPETNEMSKRKRSLVEKPAEAHSSANKSTPVRQEDGMALPELRSSESAHTTVEVRTDLLPHVTGIAYRVLAEKDGFSTVEVTWNMHSRLLTRLGELPLPEAAAPKGKQR